jgi:hypothetical protein
MGKQVSRRQFMEKSLAITGGLAAGLSLEHQALLARPEGGAAGQAAPEKITGLQKGRIGKLEVSRLLCGGNLFSGFAHSRDLVYVSALLNNYFTPEKIMDTLQISEENGINTAILRCDEHIVGVLKRYRKERGGKIQWIAEGHPDMEDWKTNVAQSIDFGAAAVYIQGVKADQF